MAARQAVRRAHILKIRVPFFRIFYSTTYTTIYIVCLAFLAITPVSMVWQAIENLALQYVVMIGGAYFLTASFAIFIFASRLHTNRTVMTGMGKAYIPVEADEVGGNIRKMIVAQYARSATIALESRPRDLVAEFLQTEQLDTLSSQTSAGDPKSVVVGREIPINPAFPPWGDVQNDGWSSPSLRSDGEMPNVQFDTVIEELPNLIEARAVSLAPRNPLATPTNGMGQQDAVVFDALCRPETMGMRDYLTQLSYLGLVNPPEIGQSFLRQYEHARFNGLPIGEPQFRRLMSTFATLLAGMTEIHPDIVKQVRQQAGDRAMGFQMAEDLAHDPEHTKDTLAPPASPGASMLIPDAAHIRPSRDTSPYLQQLNQSETSLDSIIHEPSGHQTRDGPAPDRRPSEASSSLHSIVSDTGTVVRHEADPD